MTAIRPPIFAHARAALLAAVSILLTAMNTHAGEWDVSTVVDVEVRVFPHAPSHSQQRDATLSPSLSFEPEIIYEWNGRDDRFTFKPFARWDRDDPERTHADLREASWLHLDDGWDTVVGVDKVFWGVTESRHLVDIINQTDGVENTDGEDKLGQPMVNVNVERDWGATSLFVLPGFRERTFADVKGRFAGVLAIDRDNATYDVGAKERHVDLALRWRQTYGDWDIGVAHFRGTSREPRLIKTSKNGTTVLTPHYDLIDQSSLDMQHTTDATLWKLEAISRRGHGERFFAAVGGFEHTLYGIADSQADLGLLAEYQYDGRDAATAPVTSADDDVFIGARLTLNDEQDTSLLAGALVDRATQSTVMSLEAERRLTDQLKLAIEARVLTNIDARDILSSIEDDDVLIVRLSSYF